MKMRYSLKKFFVKSFVKKPKLTTTEKLIKEILVKLLNTHDCKIHNKQELGSILVTSENNKCEVSIVFEKVIVVKNDLYIEVEATQKFLQLIIKYINKHFDRTRLKVNKNINDKEIILLNKVLNSLR